MKKKSIEHFIDMREHMSRALHKSVFLVNTISINIEFCFFILYLQFINDDGECYINLIFRYYNDKSGKAINIKEEKEKNERKSRKKNPK